MREQVFYKAKRPVLEMWVEADCLFGDVLGHDRGLGSEQPRLVRVGRGKTSMDTKDQLRLMREGYTVYMYHLDVGRVYVHPRPIKANEIQSVKLPPGFDSV